MNKTCRICQDKLVLTHANDYECQKDDSHTYEIEFSHSIKYHDQVAKIIVIQNGYQYQYSSGGSGWIFKTENASRQYKIGLVDITPNWLMQAKHYIETKESNYVPCCPICDSVLSVNHFFYDSITEYCCNSCNYMQQWVSNNLQHEFLSFIDISDRKYTICNLQDNTSFINYKGKKIQLAGWVPLNSHTREFVKNAIKNDEILK